MLKFLFEKLNREERFYANVIVSFWSIFLTVFILGLFWTIVWLIAHTAGGLPSDKDSGGDLRWGLLTLAALVGSLSALITLPLSLVRLGKTERQTKTAEESRVTDQINKAVENLGAEKQTSRLARVVHLKDGTKLFQWEDGAPIQRNQVDDESDWTTHTSTEPNLEVRIGGIYALERIAKNSLSNHVQIMEILCAYIRQNAPASKAKVVPTFNLPFKDFESVSGFWDKNYRAFGKEL